MSLSSNRSAVSHHRKRDRRVARRRLLLERLEDRKLLATIMVTSLADDLTIDGQVTLREAIEAANTNSSVDGSVAGEPAPTVDVIEFQPELVGTITLNGSRLAITEALAINGPGSELLTISGDHTSQVFYTSGVGVDVTLDGLTLTHGSGFRGGAVRNVGANLTITGSMIVNSEGTLGGGVHTAGPLTVIDSTISGNTAGQGGGLFIDLGVATLTGTTISNNRANQSYSRYFRGGGGVLNKRGTLTISDSIITRNSSAEFGGGVFNRHNATITNSTISGNTAAAGGGMLSYYGEMVVSESTVSGNAGTGLENYGGAMTVMNSTISRNNAWSGGGLTNQFGELNVINSTISGNGALEDGGGVVVHSGTVSISSSTITGNVAGLAFDEFDPDPGTGGGIWNAASTHLFNSIVSGNNVLTGFTGNQYLLPDNIRGDLEADSDSNVLGFDRNNPSGWFPDEVALDPSLTDNGGKTKTHKLFGWSAAIDFGSNSLSTTHGDDGLPGTGDANETTLQFDQRGEPFARVFGSAVDIGAYEAQRLELAVTNTDDSGPGSLRDAIIVANRNPNVFGPDRIVFDIPGAGPHRIAPLSGLPIISDPIVIDAASQPGYAGTPLVQLDGRHLIGDGLSITSGHSEVVGLSITGFTDAGIEFFSGESNLASDNFLGIDPAGVADGNYFGVKVVNSAGNTITDSVISGNDRNGVFINGVAATENIVAGNRIGTDSSGSAAVPNGKDGVSMFAPENVVIDNLISGNRGWGVFTRFDFGGGNRIEGNLIGVDATGTASLANHTGVVIRSPGNTISENTISGNANGMVISHPESNGNTVVGNLIGTDPTGTIDIGNGAYGVAIMISRDNRIGGTADDEANVISGNGRDGVMLAQAGTSFNTVLGNQIGIDITGSLAIANGGDGVRIVQGASDNFVQFNQISGNDRRGVAVAGAATARNVVFANQIGTDAGGTSPLHNRNDVAVLLTAPDNSITNNVISAVDAAIVAFTSDARGNTISGNSIGGVPALATPDGIHLLNGATGTSILGNTIVRGERGIILTRAGTGNDISRNVLFGNSIIGIDLGGDGVTPNDGADDDEGENRLQNTPVITAATVVGNDLQITYYVSSLRSIVTYPIRVEFFAADDGQARVLLGTNIYTAADRQTGAKTITLANAVSLLVPGDQLTATATDADGNTSELSLMFPVS